MFPEAEKELQAAREALIAGNDGRARVCARRAVGAVIESLQRSNTRYQDYGTHAMARLRGIAGDPGMPEEIRDAALRLSGDVRLRDREPFSTEPVKDAEMIIKYFFVKQRS